MRKVESTIVSQPKGAKAKDQGLRDHSKSSLWRLWRYRRTLVSLLWFYVVLSQPHDVVSRRHFESFRVLHTELSQ